MKPRLPRDTTWDIHAHLVPREVLKLEQQGHFGLKLNDSGWLETPSGRVRISESITESQELLEWLDKQEIWGAVISVPPALFRYDLSAEEAVAWSGMLNEGLTQIAAHSHGRLLTFASLPLQDPHAACQMVDAPSESTVGFAIGTSVGSTTLDDASLEPVFQRINQRGAIVLIHPVETEDKRMTSRYYLDNLLGNPLETSLAAACLIFSGMLSKFSNTRFCLAHAGGATPFLVGRWQRGYDTRRPGISELELPPSQAVAKFWFDSIALSTESLDFLIDQVGVTQVVLGSDYPFPMGDNNPRRSLAHLSTEDQANVLSQNFHALVGGVTGEAR